MIPASPFQDCKCGYGIRFLQDGISFWIHEMKKGDVWITDRDRGRDARVVDTFRTIAAAKKWSAEECNRQLKRRKEMLS